MVLENTANLLITCQKYKAEIYCEYSYKKIWIIDHIQIYIASIYACINKI